MKLLADGRRGLEALADKRVERTGGFRWSIVFEIGGMTIFFEGLVIGDVLKRCWPSSSVLLLETSPLFLIPEFP
jgi:hypothetical protein